MASLKSYHRFKEEVIPILHNPYFICKELGFWQKDFKQYETAQSVSVLGGAVLRPLKSCIRDPFPLQAVGGISRNRQEDPSPGCGFPALGHHCFQEFGSPGVGGEST